MEKYSTKDDKQKQEIFYPNIQIMLNENSPKFYQQIAKGWSNLTQGPIKANTALMQQVWYKKFIKVNQKPISNFVSCQLFIANLYHQNKLLDWQCFKEKFQNSKILEKINLQK